MRVKFISLILKIYKKNNQHHLKTLKHEINKIQHYNRLIISIYLEFLMILFCYSIYIDNSYNLPLDFNI